MTTNRPVVYFPGVGWDEVTGTDKLLATEISRTRPVLWVDPPVPVQHWLRERGAKGLVRPTLTVRRSPRLTTVRTVGPPWPNRLLTWRLSARCAVRAARAAGPARLTSAVISTPQPRPFPAGRRAYYATDDYPAGASLMGISERTLRTWEAHQLEAADVLLAISPVLASRWSSLGRSAVVLPNGCEPGLLERVREVLPADDVPLDRPVAGVVGQLGSRLDVDALEAVADVMSLLLVGPLTPQGATGRLAALLARPNVHWTGPQPYDRIPEFLRMMDVGLTPYVGSEFNNASIPLKTLEYLAAGLPVVSAPLPALELLPEGLVETAATPASFAEAARRAVGADSSPGFPERSRKFAAANSWAQRAQTLLSALEGETTLGGR